MIADLAPLAALTGLVGVCSVLLRRRAGGSRRGDATLTAGEAARLGVPADRPALVLFTSPGCAPCAPARRVLVEAGRARDVVLVAADVGEHHEVATAKRVFGTPTTLVLDAGHRAVARISGVPRHNELESALDEATLSTPP